MALAGALYKTVGTAANNDAEEKELEEKEFRSLFPDVYAKYHDLMVVEDSVEEEELRMRLEREASSATKNEKEEGEEGEEGGEDSGGQFVPSEEDSYLLSRFHAELFAPPIVTHTANNTAVNTDDPQLQHRTKLVREVMDGSLSLLPVLNATAITAEHHHAMLMYALTKSINHCQGSTVQWNHANHHANQKKQHKGNKSNTAQPPKDPNLLPPEGTDLTARESSKTTLTHEEMKTSLFVQFQQQPLVSETQLVIPVVRELSNRIGELLKDWPDNSLLTRISRVCTRVLLLPLSSSLSVVRVLKGYFYLHLLWTMWTMWTMWTYSLLLFTMCTMWTMFRRSILTVVVDDVSPF